MFPFTGRANFMARATAATDGLAGLRASEEGAELRTAPIPLNGGALKLRVAAHDAGSKHAVSVRVETVDGDLLLTGSVLHSALLSDSSSSEVTVVWSESSATVKAVVGKTGLTDNQDVVVVLSAGSGVTLFSFAFE